MRELPDTRSEEYKEVRVLGLFSYRSIRRNPQLPDVVSIPRDAPDGPQRTRSARLIIWIVQALAVGLVGVGLTWLLLR